MSKKPFLYQLVSTLAKNPFNWALKRFRKGIPAIIVLSIPVLSSLGLFICDELWLTLIFSIIFIFSIIWIALSMIMMQDGPPQLLPPRTINCGASQIQVVVFQGHSGIRMINITREFKIFLPDGCFIRRTPIITLSLGVCWKGIIEDNFEAIRI